MAQQMNETQRLQALEAYNPQNHLIKIKGRDGVQKDYYPAAYRFYELNLRYPNANFSTDLIYYDLEKNFCVVKCRLYLGADYDTSEKKAESMKQGLFTALDKVETAGKARCLRDFGIGTEYALEFSDEDEDMETAARLTQPAPRTPQNRANQVNTRTPTLSEVPSVTVLRKRVEQMYGPNQWENAKASALGQNIPDEALSPDHCIHISQALDAAQAKADKARAGNSNGQAATEQQLSSIKKLADNLGGKVYDVPKTYEEAKNLIATLSQQYRESRKVASGQ